MKQVIRLVLAGLVVLGLAACGSSDSGTRAPTYAGAWSGEIVDDIVGTGTVTANLTQRGNELGGTWRAVYPEFTNSGSAVGLVNGSDVLIELWPSDPTTCPFRLTATRSGDSLSGTYAAFNCTASISGQITLTKD